NLLKILPGKVSDFAAPGPHLHVRRTNAATYAGGHHEPSFRPQHRDDLPRPRRGRDVRMRPDRPLRLRKPPHPHRLPHRPARPPPRPPPAPRPPPPPPPRRPGAPRAPGRPAGGSGKPAGGNDGGSTPVDPSHAVVYRLRLVVASTPPAPGSPTFVSGSVS